MRSKEFISEGGWASTKTQNTIITPALIEKVVTVLKAKFEPELNAFLKSKQLPSIQIGKPCGSGTYYKRDLVQNPNKEYGDIDVHFYIPRMPDLNNNQTITLFATNIKEFCDRSTTFATENGKNVILQLGDDYVQIDLVNIYYDVQDWATALAPEWNVKGVLCASLYSALAEALQISISSIGVQAKTINGKLVKFNTVKGVKLHTITTDKKKWAIDIATFFGASEYSPTLKSYPGLIDEVRVKDIIGSIKGIAETLEQTNTLPSQYSDSQSLLSTIKQIYLDKINKVITSSKFDKAETETAIKKAADTKSMLTTKSSEIGKMIA